MLNCIDWIQIFVATNSSLLLTNCSVWKLTRYKKRDHFCFDSLSFHPTLTYFKSHLALLRLNSQHRFTQFTQFVITNRSRSGALKKKKTLSSWKSYPRISLTSDNFTKRCWNRIIVEEVIWRENVNLVIWRNSSLLHFRNSVRRSFFIIQSFD